MTCFSALKTNRSRLNRIQTTTYLADPEEARPTWKNHLIVNSETLGLQIWRKKVNYDNFKIVTNSINQMFNPNAFFSLLWGATWYYNTIYILLTYFASFIGYSDEILEVISNLHVQVHKFGSKKDKFVGKSFKKLNSAEFIEVFFPKSDQGLL